MVIHTHGDKSKPVIVILHPMGITGEKMYEVLGNQFQGSYFFICPDMGGHGQAYRPFKSAVHEAKALHRYLTAQGISRIHLLFGASLGCAVALQFLRYEDIDCNLAYLEGAPVAKLNFAMRRIFSPVLLLQKNMIQANREKGIRDFVRRYGRDIAEHMADNFLAFDRQTITRIGHVCAAGTSPFLTADKQERLYFTWGAKELYANSSRPEAEARYPLSHTLVRSGYEHCEAIFKMPEYVNVLELFAARADAGNLQFDT